MNNDSTLDISDRMVEYKKKRSDNLKRIIVKMNEV